MKKLREMKKNNKGFSLVELIVVIAIMVVLIAVLGSTILGYVEKSKYSKDIQALDSIKTAVSTFVADPDAVYKSGDKYKLAALMVSEGENAPDPNGVIASTLQEVFKTTTDKDGNSTMTFNNSSEAFEGITTNDVWVIIDNGAVSICVPVIGDDYNAYTAGSYEWSDAEQEKSTTKSANE